MNEKKKIVIPALAVCTIVGAMAYSVQSTYAKENDSSSSLITRIAETFNLSEDDVKSVFEEEREARAQKSQEQYEEMLTQAVADGEITEEQKQLIIEKNAEIKASHESSDETSKEDLSTLSDEEREALMEEHRANAEAARQELEAWAEENGIDIKYLMIGGRGIHGDKDAEHSSSEE